MLVWVAFVAVVLAAGAWEFVRLRATNRSWITARAIPGWRAYRSVLLRIALWLLSWPHVLDRLLRTHRLPATAATPTDVARWPGARLQVYRAAERCGAPVLVMHALVTQPWILDLAPGCSLVEALTDGGRDVYLLDCGQPDKKRATDGIADKAAAVRTAIDQVAAAESATGVHVVGYCTGATVALIAAAIDSTRVASLALIAPVVDTAVPGGMRPMMASRWLLPAALLDGNGCVPAAAVRESFHVLRPMALRAARQRWRLRHDAAATRIAGALTRWTWEQRALPGGVFFDLVDLFRTNPLMERGWPVGDAVADLRTIDRPTLIAVTDRDHIVPVASSLALTHVLAGRTEVVRCAGGHVSMVAGVDAQRTLYPSLRAWFDGIDVELSER